ncbi:MAG: hypothetical protein KKB31_04775, partial [Nanoarchaeota archaeon]|nr:hypothetical protein [Nanoarchaeota archaeon]
MIKKIKRDKKGYFFSLDAFIALVIILGIVLLIKPPVKQNVYETHVHEDLMDVLSSLSFEEMNNSYAEGLRNNPAIGVETNKSVLEYIGELFALGYIDEPSDLVDSFMNDLNLKQNIGIYYDDAFLGGKVITPEADAETLSTTRQVLGGIRRNNSEFVLTGYSARAFLSYENKVDYFYFGGYVGDGNITALIDGDVIGANIEGDFSGDFDVYVNGIASGSHTPTPGTPYSFSLSSYLGNFITGENYIDFRAPSGNLFIAGGYIRVVYDSSEVPMLNGKHRFPGIEGLINIYDGFYVPGDLNSLNITLHYNSSYNIFLIIGNKSIYFGNSSGAETTINIPDSTLSSLLDYSSMSGNTVPVRFGIANASYVQNVSIDADVFSVTDLSGSMCDCSQSGWFCTYDENRCGSHWSCSSGVCTGGINEARDANDAFIDAVLNTSANFSNRVGLVGYESVINAVDTHDLSDDNVSLKNTVAGWRAVGGTCICCGI